MKVIFLCIQIIGVALILGIVSRVLWFLFALGWCAVDHLLRGL